HRGLLRISRDLVRLPFAELGKLCPLDPRRRPNHGDGAADHRDGCILLLADGLYADPRAADRPAERHLAGSADDPPVAERAAAAARHLHGHGADDHHLHADLPAGGHRLWRRSGPLRGHPYPQPRHKPEHTAGGGRAVRRLRGRQDYRLAGYALHLAVLPRKYRRAWSCHLHTGAIVVVTKPVQVGSDMPADISATTRLERKPKLSEHVATALRTQILSGDIRPG